MRIAILGFGKEGKSTLAYLKQAPEYRNAEITILDRKQDRAYLRNLESYDLIIKTPGIPFSLPEIKKAFKKGVHFSSATELFFSKAQGLIVGITGTKGKGTTATLLYKMLKTSGLEVHLAGNIGRPMLDLLPKLTKKSITILELSSFQLQYITYSPQIAVVLDIFPDHLDAHANLKEYVDAKMGIAKNQKKQDAVYYVKGNRYSEKIAKASPGQKVIIDKKAFTLFSGQDMRVPGAHNFQNAVVAATIALRFGVKPEIIKKVVRGFRGLPLRLQFVVRLDGVDFYNDSASTNPYASAAAVRAFDRPSILIAGGKDKGFGYESLAEALRGSTVKLVVLYGENKSRIYMALKDCSMPVEMSPTLELAVRRAFTYARKVRSSEQGWAIVFSPGAASFDMFADYKERGEAFNTIVKKLKV